MRNVEIEISKTSDVLAPSAAESETVYKAAENLSKLFYLLALLEFLIIPCGAVLGLFVAPASLFAARTQSDEIAAIVVALVGIGFATLALIALPLALLAALGIKRAKRYGRICGILASVPAIFQFPLGTIFGALLLRKIFKTGASGNR